MTIGIIWINHHQMIARLREADHSILILNLVLLMTIGVLPFATDLTASFLRHSGESLAAAVYSGCFLLMSLAFVTLNRHVLLDRAEMLEPPMTLPERRRILVQAAAGVVPYAIATLLAFISAYLSLGICAAIAFYYALPVAYGASSR
jgi:uncharacterized membrane protein